MGLDWPEAMGLLSGEAAAAAICDGLALPLHGGKFAFPLWRDSAGRVRPAGELPEAWRRRFAVAPPPFAGLPQHRARPLIMGIVNCTPDSFSGDGLGAGHAEAIAQGEAMLAAGADLLDIGGESTRPGAEPVPPGEEQHRILPVIQALARVGCVSVDTRNASTMRAAIEAGARIVNDVSALRHDPSALAVVASLGCPVVLMHARTTDPRTMQQAPSYADAPREVAGFLEERIMACEAAGIPRARIAVDPGIGFGKRVEDNLALVERLPILAGLGCTILLGASRKGFIGRITGAAEPAGRVMGSVALALAGAARGAHILRVHDVRQTMEALRMAEALTAGWPA
jgi:dihydropteroate synthase